jgi:hypothetical protein
MAPRRAAEDDCVWSRGQGSDFGWMDKHPGPLPRHFSSYELSVLVTQFGHPLFRASNLLNMSLLASISSDDQNALLHLWLTLLKE